MAVLAGAPHAFDTLTDLSPTYGGHFRDGTTITAGMTFPSRSAHDTPQVIHIDSALPYVVTNTPDATITVSVCALSPDPKFGVIGSVSGRLAGRWCTRLADAADTDMTLHGDPWEQLLLTITATRPGVVRVAGIGLTYSYGHRHGTQRVGLGVRFVFKDPAR